MGWDGIMGRSDHGIGMGWDRRMADGAGSDASTRRHRHRVGSAADGMGGVDAMMGWMAKPH